MAPVGTPYLSIAFARSGDRVAPFREVLRSLAAGMQDQDRWTFKRTGFLAPRITVQQNGSDANFAEFTPNWYGGGLVIFASGRRYPLHKTNFWGTSWAFEAPDGTAAVTLSGPSGSLKQSGKVQVAPEMATSAEAPVLVILIWYGRLLMNEDAAAVAVIGGSGKEPSYRVRIQIRLKWLESMASSSIAEKVAVHKR